VKTVALVIGVTAAVLIGAGDALISTRPRIEAVALWVARR
jgi:hypothetical protein